MATKKKVLTAVGKVFQVGYDINSRTVLYVNSESAETFGIQAKIIPVGTDFESYSSEYVTQLVGKDVKFSYTGLHDGGNRFVGELFVKFKEEDDE